MGVVYRATDPAIGRTVAIKTIRLSSSSAEDRDQHVARLRREAQSAGRLSHPHIVTVFDFIESGDAACVCLEFIDGPSLEVVLNREKSLPRQEILRILRQAAEALDYAHSRGVVHRDIKPANILLSAGLNVKITDFGIAALVNDDATMTAPLAGTPSYMSPEQVLSQPISGFSDQFSLAVIAYQMLTGEKPFPGASMPSIVYKICNESPELPSSLNPELNSLVDEVFTRALSKKPADRYATVIEFVTELESALAGEKKPVPAAVAGPVETRPEQKVRAIPPAGRVPSGNSEVPERNKISPLLYALAGFAAVALILLLMLPSGEKPDRQNQAPEAAQSGTDSQTLPDSSGNQDESAQKTDDEEVQPTGTAGDATDASTESLEEGQNTADATADSGAGTPSESSSEQPAPVDAATKGNTEKASPAPVPSLPVQSEKPRQKAAAAAPTAPEHPLAIATNPAGATIVVDAIPSLTCKTPCKLTLEAGRHSLKADRAGYRTAYRNINIPEDSAIRIPMETRAGTVMVRSNPAGARIFVNGKEWSQTTPAMMTLPEGKHVIELRKEGFRNDTNQITLRDGAVLNLDVNWPGQ